jgi:hypothetical protein
LAKAADIVVNLVAKTGRFSSGMDRGQRKMNNFKKSAGGASKALKLFGTALASVGAGAGIGALSSMVKQVIDANDQLGKMSTTLGIATDKLRGIQLAAELAGVQTSALNKGLGKMQKAIVDAANGLTTYQRHFDRLGISTAELLALAPEEQFKRIGQGLAGLRSQTERIAIAYDIFGGRNIQLINLLTQQAGSIENVTSKAVAMGVALEGFDVARFEAAKDQLTLMATAMEGMRNSLAREVIPFVQLLSVRVQGVAVSANEAGGAFAGWGFQTALILGVIVSIGKTIAFIAKLLLDFQIGVGKRLLEGFNIVETKARGLVAKLQDAFGLDSLDPAAGFIQNLLDTMTAFQDSLEASAGEFKGFEGEMDGYIDKWHQANIEVAKQAKAIQAQRDLLQEQADALLEFLENQKAGAAAETEALKRQATLASLIAGTRTAEEKLLESIVFLQEAIRDGEGEQNELIEARTRLVGKLLEAREDEEALSQVGIQAARNMQDAFAEFFKSTGDGFKNLLQSFVNMLRDMVAQLLARKLLLSFFGAITGFGGGIGKFASAVVGDLTKRAAGGTLIAGQPALVGERGPELFVPNSSGFVFPNHRLGGGGVTINQNIDARGADEARILRVMPGMLKIAEDNAVSRVAGLMAEGRI